MAQQIVESSGRSFTPEEINLICQTAKTFSNLSLTELSKTLCELLEWKRPNGKLKYEECRAFLERLQSEGVVSIPRLRSAGSPGPRRVNISAHVESEVPVSGSVGRFEPLRLKLVLASNRELMAIFKQLIERFRALSRRVRNTAGPVSCLPPVLQSGMENGAPRCMDRMEQPAAEKEPSVHRFQQPLSHSAILFH
jgi:hypothetical protein